VTPEEQAAQEAAQAEAAAEAAEDAAEDAEEQLSSGEGTTFDLKYVKSLRAEAAKYRREARDAQNKVKDFEDASKTEIERATERLTNAESTAAQATEESARLKVALKKGLTIEQSKRLVGENEEELEADADSLIELFTANESEQDQLGTPRERLKPGAVPSAENEETDPGKLAESVPRPYQ